MSCTSGDKVSGAIRNAYPTPGRKPGTDCAGKRPKGFTLAYPQDCYRPRRARKEGIRVHLPDITQKFIPTLVLSAYPDSEITSALALEIAHGLVPTPPFQEE
jgi:hypothetical protein